MMFVFSLIDVKIEALHLSIDFDSFQWILMESLDFVLREVSGKMEYKNVR